MNEQVSEANSNDQSVLRRLRPARLMWFSIPGIIVAIVSAIYLLNTQSDAAGSSNEVESALATTEVSRQTISDTRRFNGTLTHGAAFTVHAGSHGTITGIANQGTHVERGTELFRIDERPVSAMFGDVPMYRDLHPPHRPEASEEADEPEHDTESQDAEAGEQPNAEPGDEPEAESEPEPIGDSGIDVAQLIENLTALGYADCEAVDAITACVEDAIRHWQRDIGLPDTGVVSRSDIVFVSEGGRVDSIHHGVGSSVAPGVPILDISGRDLVVTVELHMRDRELLAVDTEVSVQLPGGDTVHAIVTQMSVVADTSSGGMSGSNSTNNSIAVAEVTLHEPVNPEFIGAPADVLVEVDERQDVLVVPVNALLAMTGGGHGLEVVAGDGSTSLMPVDTGLIAAGQVEVTGPGIEEGTVVGVAGR